MKSAFDAFNFTSLRRNKKTGEAKEPVTIILAKDEKLPMPLTTALHDFHSQLVKAGGKVILGRDGGLQLPDGSLIGWSAHSGKGGNGNWSAVTAALASAASMPDLLVDGDRETGDSPCKATLPRSVYTAAFKNRSDGGASRRYNPGGFARVMLALVAEGNLDEKTGLIKAGTRLVEQLGPKKAGAAA